MLNLGLSVIIFLVIGVVVMALFCLVTRHFNKKLEKALENQNQVYSMIQQIRGNAGNQEDGDQYENYVQKKENQAMNKDNNKNSFQLQMTDVNQPLKGYGAEDVYGMGKLKKRLDGQPIPLNPETGRSKTSLRSFRPQKLDSMRKSNISQRKQAQNTEPNQDISQADPNNPNNTKKPRRKDKKRQNVVTHKYINRIVCYIQQGIFIVQNHLLSIEKREKMIQKRTTKKSTVKPDQKSFEDTLEAYGFQKSIFCAFKFQTTLQVPHMKPNQQYPVSSLKNTESKSPIQFAQFYNLRDQLEEIN